MEDSSPDLSLKLRRGSSDSRDSFYMDFAQGIDSDIEDMATTSGAADVGETTGGETASPIAGISKEEGPSWPSIPPNNISGGSGTCSSRIGGRGRGLGSSSGGDPLLPSPASPSAVIVSPETLSHHSSPARAHSHAASVGIATGSHPGGGGSVRTSTVISGMTPSCSHHVSLSSPVRHSASRHSGGMQQPGPLALAPLNYHGYPQSQLPALRRPSRVERQTEWRQLGADALATTLSALYGKLLVVMGTAFPMAEVISTYIPPSFYEWFYLYLYIGSMLFLLYMYAMLLRGKKQARRDENNQKSRDLSISDSGEESDTGETSKQTDSNSSNSVGVENNRYRGASRRSSYSVPPRQYHYGSFYLRMGAVAFGIGSMIYSGLEFGQYFELETNTKCHNVLLALTPATRMAFTFIQMYFIFLNNEQMKVYKHKITARFGLMHMIGTNLSVWLNVLVQETKHEILTFYNPENNSLRISHRLGAKSQQVMNIATTVITSEHLPTAHHIVARGLKGPHNIYECRRTNIIGSLVQDASPFLFPCTIEYSLICAAILYVMWKNISKLPNSTPFNAAGTKLKPEGLSYKRSPHHYSVDCARAHKGLFVGILILVLTIISLILFFVLISRPEFANLAVMEVNICELTLYGVTTLASLLGMFQVRVLKYDGSRNLELDNILLIGAQTGMFIYSTFTIIGGQFTIEKNTILVVITALTSLLQTTCQTMFVLDASRRSCVTPDQIRRKPGREIVTFLLVTNLAMWAINTLEKSRAESHPIQLHFYGLWAWTIITHVSMPLAILNDYPSCSPPQFQISAPDLTRHMKNIISNELNNTYLENIGEPLIYQWIEKVRDIIEADSKTETNINSTNEPEVVCTNPEEYQNVHLSIIHGPLIQDRKSTFQGHVAPVHSKEDVDQMLNALLQNRKISQATHNILAYRIEIQNTKIILQDCDDDGEVNAGGRLLHLLNVLHVTNVAVVVSRWYGGIHLGPDRFRHINNAARQVLEIANLIKPGK